MSQFIKGEKIGGLVIVIFVFLLRLYYLPKLNLKNGQLVKVIGTLSEEPQVFGNRQNFRLAGIEVLTNRFPEWHYGDQLEIIGRLEAKNSSFLGFINFTNYSLKFPKIEKLGSKEKVGVLEPLMDLRSKLKSLFRQVLPSPYDGLLAGIVLGDKSLITSNFWQELKQTGTLHIVVASGMNVAFLSSLALSFFTLFVKRKVALLFLLFLIFFYSILTGLQPPIVRASLMISLVYLGQLLGRQVEEGRVLGLTAALMLFFNPYLFFDLGFQLSFLATCGLIFLSPKLFKEKFFLFRFESFRSSLAAQLATLPILVMNFGQLNLISPFINLLILWSLPLVLSLGVVIAATGLIWPTLGQAFSYFVFPFLFFVKQIVSLSAKLNCFQFFLPLRKWYWWLGYYGLLSWWIGKSFLLRISKREDRNAKS